MTQPATDQQPSSNGLTRTVIAKPVYGLTLVYKVPGPSPRLPEQTGDIFLDLDYLAEYAEEAEWADWGADVWEDDPVQRSAMLDSGLAEFAYPRNAGMSHSLRRTAKFVDVWNDLFADLPGQQPLKRSKMVKPGSANR